MGRPKTKVELLEQSGRNYEKLLKLVEGLSEKQKAQVFPSHMLNRNISDVICHLHEWHNLMLSWYTVGMAGDKPAMPAAGYTWKTTPELNAEIQKKYSQTSLQQASTLLSSSHSKVIKLIARHSNKELFTKKFYRWTGSTSLGAYLISATSSHYDWAFKLIKKALL